MMTLRIYPGSAGFDVRLAPLSPSGTSECAPPSSPELPPWPKRVAAGDYMPASRMYVDSQAEYWRDAALARIEFLEREVEDSDEACRAWRMASEAGDRALAEQAQPAADRETAGRGTAPKCLNCGCYGVRGERFWTCRGCGGFLGEFEQSEGAAIREDAVGNPPLQVRASAGADSPSDPSPPWSAEQMDAASDICSFHVAVEYKTQHWREYKGPKVCAEIARHAHLFIPDAIDVLFDGPPSHESGRFVEVENMKGASISVGQWIDRKDGFWALRIPLARPAAAAVTREQIARACMAGFDRRYNLIGTWEQKTDATKSDYLAQADVVLAILPPPTVSAEAFERACAAIRGVMMSERQSASYPEAEAYVHAVLDSLQIATEIRPDAGRSGETKP